MNFGLSEEQELLQETIDRFISNECGLVRLHEIFDGDSAHDPNLWEGLMTLGLGGLTVPESYGGAGLELVDLALAAEVMGRHALPGPYLGHALAALAIQLGGSEAQKERWLPGLATGDRIGTRDVQRLVERAIVGVLEVEGPVLQRAEETSLGVAVDHRWPSTSIIRSGASQLSAADRPRSGGGLRGRRPRPLPRDRP